MAQQVTIVPGARVIAASGLRGRVCSGAETLAGRWYVVRWDNGDCSTVSEEDLQVEQAA